MKPKYSLKKDLKNRTCQSLDFTFLGSHFFLGIIFFSGLGIWIEVFKLALSLQDSSWQNFKLALIFYPPAVFGSSGIYLLLTDQKRKLRTLILMLAATLGIITFTLSFTFKNATPWLYWPSNFITIFIAIWVWILANSPNRELFSDDDNEVDAASGGPPQSKLAGDDSEFQTED